MVDLSRIPVDLAYTLYRNASKRSLMQRIFHIFSIAVVSSMVKLVFLRHGFKVVNKETLLEAVNNRPSYQPLITVSNHHSCLDDFVMFGGSLPYRSLFNVDRLRWTLAAVDICFLSNIRRSFFVSGKGVPVWRRVRDPETKAIIYPGLGVHQPSMDFCIDLLNSGYWVHSFSQGRIIMPNERANETDVTLRWGVGRLLAEARVDPMVIPIWHCGIDDLSPCKEPYTLNVLKSIFGPNLAVTLVVGTPFKVDGLKQNCRLTESALHARLTDRVQSALYQLKPVAEYEHARHLASLK